MLALLRAAADRKETSQLCSPPDGGAAKQLP
nr:MAG TPA: hypothetical protein [Caudoviricetes sp.]